MIPNLPTRFGFKELLRPGHPAREAYEAYQWNFDQGPRLLLYFHGPGAFGAPFLRRAGALAHELRRLQGTGGVLSAMDLAAPRIKGKDQLLSRILRDEVLEDPARLATTLRGAPFDRHFRGFLYDDDLEVFVMVVTPPLDDRDPAELFRYVGRVRDLAEAAGRDHGLEVHLGGDFFVHQEVRRVALESQIRLTSLVLALQVLLFWLLFRSVALALSTFFLLGTSVLLGVAAMALVGIPVTFLSANLSLMILVIGTADVIHIAGRYAALRRDYRPLGASLRAARETSLPVFLTSLTTAGCLLVTSFTPLDALRQFSLSLALGVAVVWAVTILYGPLLFRRVGVSPGPGAYFALHEAIGTRLPPLLCRLTRGPRVRRVFLVLAALGGGLVAGQRVDSNWYRYFGPSMPVTRSLEFLHREGLPVSMIDVTLDVPGDLFETLADEALAGDVRRFAAALARQRGVSGVEHLYTQRAFVDEAVDAVEYPPEVTPEWAASRRDALRRQYAAVGVYDRYFGARRNQLRIVGLSQLESSADFVRLRRDLEAALDHVPLERARREDFHLAGQMHYWSAIMAALPETFLQNLWGCGLVILVCFLVLTGSPRLSLLALVPNVLPVVLMFGLGRLLDIPLNENVCFATSLAIGIAVDDTLHFLYHYGVARRRGLPIEGAIRRTLEVVGAPIVVTSLLLVAGFSVCLVDPVAPIWQMGALILIAVLVALAGDLLLLPSLLFTGAGEAAGVEGERRGYALDAPASRVARR